VGLLVGDSARPVARLMTCLTVTPATADEAVGDRADLVVAHHPLPFEALRRLTRDHLAGRLLLDLAGARIALYSPHTAFDSAAAGINQRLAEGLGLCGLAPLVPGPAGLGVGRMGRFDPPITLAALADRTRRFLAVGRLQLVGDPGRPVGRAAVACGAAGELWEAAVAAGCQAMVLGETRFHTCLEAESAGLGLVMPGHFASERFAVEQLAAVLARQFPQVCVWASRREQDPIRWWDGGEVRDEGLGMRD
jgi:dinuclear metal center YbgI/SA1388 family protein